MNNFWVQLASADKKEKGFGYFKNEYDRLQTTLLVELLDNSTYENIYSEIHSAFPTYSDPRIKSQNNTQLH